MILLFIRGFFSFSLCQKWLVPETILCLYVGFAFLQRSMAVVHFAALMFRKCTILPLDVPGVHPLFYFLLSKESKRVRYRDSVSK